MMNPKPLIPNPEQFYKLPAWLCEMKDISATSCKVWCYYANCADSDGRAWPNNRTVAEKCACSISQVKTSRKQLIDRGLMELHPEGGRGGACYLVKTGEDLPLFGEAGGVRRGSESGRGGQKVTVCSDVGGSESGRGGSESGPSNRVYKEGKDSRKRLKNKQTQSGDVVDTENGGKPKSGKKSRNRTATDEELSALIPKLMRCDRFAAAWSEFAAHRREIGRGMTVRAAKSILGRLEPFGIDWIVKRIATAIERGWTGLIFDSDDPAKVGGSNGSTTAGETFVGGTKW